MANILNGWIGYGGSMIAGAIVEPSDTSYTRRPVAFGTLDRTTLVDLAPGTVGPASTNWGVIQYIGIFDAQVAGNLLLWLPTPGVMTVQAGMSITAAAGSLKMSFPSLVGGSAIVSWPTGAVVATTPDGRAVTVGAPLQLAGSVIAAQAPAFGSSIQMSSLPQSQPASGTGQLWNNGGVISVA